jgi:hypothetical protein
MGRFRDWVRAEAAAMLRPEFDATRDEMQRSLHDSSGALLQQIVREHADTRRQMLEQQAGLGDRTRSLVDALDQMRAHLDAHRTAQRAQLQALEGTLRDLMIAIGPSTAPRPTILAGSVEPATAGGDDDRNEIDLTGRFSPGTLVEARSRFGDGWFEGLEVAETVQEADGERYRLTRRRDGRRLPMLFDAVDLRPATAGEFRARTG